MKTLNKNGVHFLVDDDIDTLRVTAFIEDSTTKYNLNLDILEDKVILLNSSHSEAWKDIEKNPFFDKSIFIRVDGEYHKYIDEWSWDSDVTPDSEIDNLKKNIGNYKETIVYINGSRYKALEFYTEINDDKVYKSFETFLYEVLNMSIKGCGKKPTNMYSCFDTDLGTTLRQHLSYYTTLKDAASEKYDIALITDTQENIDYFINNDKVKKCLLSYGKGSTKIEALAYCNVETKQTLIVDVSGHYSVIEDNVIYRELNNLNIYGKDSNMIYYYIGKYSEYIRDSLQEYRDIGKVSALNISKSLNAINSKKCVLTSNPVIAYQLVTGKNVTSTGFWKDIDGNNLKKFLNNTEPKAISVKTEHVQKVDGISEIIAEAIEPLIESVNNLTDTIANKEIVIDKPKSTEVQIQEEHIESKPYTLEDFNNNVQGVNADELVKILKIKKAVILISPPGTGKTTTAIELAKYIKKETNSDKVKLLSFNQTTSYSDIIGGYKTEDGNTWLYEDGELTKLSKKALEDSSIHILILDEINRANTESVLGEAITALSKRGEYVTTNNGSKLCIPDNLYVIATMNSTDNSITSLDTALADRFAIYRMEELDIDCRKIKPEASALLLQAMKVVADSIKNINKELEKDVYKGKDNTIGNRALYTDYSSIEELITVVEYDIKPKVEAKLNSLNDEQQSSIRRILKETISELADMEELKD